MPKKKYFLFEGKYFFIWTEILFIWKEMLVYLKGNTCLLERNYFFFILKEMLVYLNGNICFFLNIEILTFLYHLSWRQILDSIQLHFWDSGDQMSWNEKRVSWNNWHIVIIALLNVRTRKADENEKLLWTAFIFPYLQ